MKIFQNRQELDAWLKTKDTGYARGCCDCEKFPCITDEVLVKYIEVAYTDLQVEKDLKVYNAIPLSDFVKDDEFFTKFNAEWKKLCDERAQKYYEKNILG